MSEARAELTRIIADIDYEMDDTMSNDVLAVLGPLKRKLVALREQLDDESAAEYAGDDLDPYRHDEDEYEDLADWERELLELPPRGSFLRKVGDGIAWS